ncbi:junctional adhesion molecule 3B-like [Pristis pectinata]|uniref:junctional adhesion molecule 3B-like n=1 Tax=Pristis pectinata TaxID=685728 RepID=UPI00223CECE2|nr:junctional adhesion molecule 3B-like [Pristis pectinata]
MLTRCRSGCVKMAGGVSLLRLLGLYVVLAESYQVWAKWVTTENPTLVVNEFDSVVLSCVIHSSQHKHRIEWKKLNAGTDLVYFDKQIQGDLINRAELQGDSSIKIRNVTRKDTAVYRCEVVFVETGHLDEVSVNLTVQVKPVTPKCTVPKSVPVGKAAVLTCREHEGYPPPTYIWYKNGDVLPRDPKSNPKFFNSSYKINYDTGTLHFSVTSKLDIGEYHCIAKNGAGQAKCEPQRMEVYDINIAAIIGGILIVVLVLLIISIVIRLAYKRGYFAKKQPANRYQASSKADSVDYVRSSPVDAEGDFRHKSSFII